MSSWTINGAEWDLKLTVSQYGTGIACSGLACIFFLYFKKLNGTPDPVRCEHKFKK
jgi:hypothetical protein